MLRSLSALSFSVGLLLALLLILVGMVPVYDLVQSWAGVEETTGYSRDFLHQANVAMRDYLYGYRDNLFIEKGNRSLFGGQEVFHMAEVRQLFTGLARASLVLLIFSLLLSLKLDTRIFRDQLYGMGALLLLLGFAGFFFNRAFVIMHGIFFDNDLWLFPWDSELIRLLPQDFFFYFTLLIIGVFIVVSVGIYLVERIYYDFASRQG